ncbi:MAG: 3-hydroxy-3-methylglutaryl-CoA reductase, partial [Anaerolineales bacterium]|nr:3-hydroxy-3-methylglutaryl-CoA reductase [Anaerolineales bacterium]
MNDDSPSTSRIAGFYQLDLEARLQKLVETGWLSTEDLAVLRGESSLALAQAEHMIENVVGVYALPFGIVLNLLVNDREVLAPMAIEEPSVVAGASFMARLARAGGGFHAQADPPEMIGQVQVLGVADVHSARAAILGERPRLLELASGIDPVLQELGGGPRDLEVRIIADSPIGPFLVVHLIYDVRDAMGANAVNTAVERLAPQIEAICGGKAHLR